MKIGKSSTLLPKVSYSWKYLYEWCPRQFKYARVEKFTPDEAKSPATITGIAIHRVVELMYSKKNFSIGYVRGAWPYVFDNTFKREGFRFSSKLNRDRWYYKGLDILEAAYKMADENKMLIEPIAVEHKFSIEVRSNTGRRFVVKGKIDLILKIGDEIWVLDLKTGNYVPSKKELDIHDQLTIYSLAVKLTLGLDNIKLGLWYPDKKKIYWTTRRTQKDYDILVEEIEKDQVSIENEEFDPTYKLCKMCTFRDRCATDDAKSVMKETEVPKEWFYRKPKGR